MPFTDIVTQINLNTNPIPHTDPNSHPNPNLIHKLHWYQYSYQQLITTDQNRSEQIGIDQTNITSCHVISYLHSEIKLLYSLLSPFHFSYSQILTLSFSFSMIFSTSTSTSTSISVVFFTKRESCVDLVCVVCMCIVVLY